MVLGRPRRRSDARRIRLIEHKLRGFMGGRRGAIVSQQWDRRRSPLSRERPRAHGADCRRNSHGRHVRHDHGCPRLQGADPIIIASFANALQYRFVVRPNIRNLADLKGKRVGVAGFGLGAHRGAQIILARLGLNPDTDVTMLQIGGDPTRMSALLSGTIDATVFNPPLHQRAVEAGMKIIANIEDMNFPVQGSALVTTERFIKKNTDGVRRAIKSVIESIHLIKTNPELTKRAIKKYMRFKDDRDTDEAYQIMRDIAPRKPYPTVEGMRAVLDELSPKLPAAKTAQPRDFMDTRFIEELDRAGFIDRLYK